MPEALPDRIDHVVVGAGVVGAATARTLAAAGRAVLLLERFGRGHDRGSSHGASRIFRLGYTEADWVRLALRASDGWERLEAAADTVLLERTGAVDHGRADVLHAIVAAFVEAGVPHERLTPVEAAERWPGLVFDDAVVAHAAGGRIRSAAALDAFLDLATADGADLRFDHGVRSVTVVEDDAVVVLDDGRTIRTPSLVVAAGSWVPTLVGDLLRERGARLPAVTVTEEQPAHFPGHVADDSWPSFVHYPQDGGDVYGLLTPGEGVKVGFHGTGPIVHPDERTFRPTEDGADALRRYVGRWVPGVDAERATPVSCLYDNTPDGDFVIDRTGPVTVATGFSGHGFKFAPVLGELVADLALGGTTLPRFAFRD